MFPYDYGRRRVALNMSNPAVSYVEVNVKVIGNYNLCFSSCITVQERIKRWSASCAQNWLCSLLSDWILLLYEYTSCLNALRKQPFQSDTSIPWTPGLLLYLRWENERLKLPCFCSSCHWTAIYSQKVTWGAPSKPLIQKHRYPAILCTTYLIGKD